ncbi:uncharacterized protein [Asterias amurensis]|uniref:uncharacterized protein isoform X2 n=2 Tax=Asterias amurensis TaxID=7602 RepID=UPI003AB6DA69
MHSSRNLRLLRASFTMADSKPKRLALWTCARSLSTAMVMSFGNYGNVEVFNEMYTGACAFGPDRKMGVELPFPVEESLTFENVKSQMEADYPNKDLVFIKDHAAGMFGHYDQLPDGFTHAFIIRNPEKTIASGVKLAAKTNFSPEEYLQTYKIFANFDGYAFGDLVALADHIEKVLGQPLVILDADDLQRDPEKMLRLFCKAVGLPFRESLLKWEPIEEIPWHNSQSLLTIHKANGAYEAALKSTGWITGEPKPADLSQLPQIVLNAIEEARPFYQTLYEKRLMPDD